MEENQNPEVTDYDALLKSHKPFKIALKYGVLLAMVTIIIDLVFFIITNDPTATSSGGLSVLQMVVLGALTIYLASKEHSMKDLQGYIPYKRIMGMGALVGLFSGVVTGLYAVLKSKYMYDPNLDIELRITEELEKTASTMSEEEYEKAKDMAIKFAKIFISAPVMLVMSILFSTFWSFILSLLVGLSFKKEFPQD
ncbi:MAG: DUF4199 domain-containing protein [Bacteroidia bacterium]|nr:DUF4199 domain-containing protein [Bacteroidia bacterium]